MPTALRIDSSTQAPAAPTRETDGLYGRLGRLRDACEKWWRRYRSRPGGPTRARARERRGGGRLPSPRNSGQRGLEHPLEHMAVQLYRAGLHHVR